MIYTCYEMVRDCRADKPEGWRHFAAHYVPVIRKLLAHYGGASAPAVEPILEKLKRPESSLFASLEPAPERWFVAELRQKVLAEIEFATPEIEIDLETAGAALAPLTVVEKQAVWTEMMGYSPEEAGAMLRAAPATVSKIRDRGAELLRGQVDTWRRTLFAENGPQLGRAAAAAATKDCLPPKPFLDVLDGRATWAGREELERHVGGCLHCIDHFARMAEVIEMLRGVTPLSEEEAAPFYRVLGVAAKPKKGWRRLLSV
jgi:hypothetical protein